MGGGLLLDRDRRRQAFDGVHIGLFHHRQELPGIGRQGLHIAALALGVESVEGQRRLARTGQTGDHDQLVAGQGEVDVLQVMGACPTDQDLVHNGLTWRAETRDYTARRLNAAKRHKCVATRRDC
ncbi:hypothetical protein FQZ97_819070 [compost metagenome]